MLWDVFCRVIDNYGDVGVCWRLAADLGRRGHTVRLWLDDPRALDWMAPDGAAGVSTHPWQDDTPWPDPGDVVIEAFGCDPPAPFVAAMAARSPAAPVWINLEYLSAQAYVERSHALASPQWHGPGAGLVKHFFYPGFTTATGGLLREPGLLDACAQFDADHWLARYGWAAQPGEQVVSLFCYQNACLPHWLEGWTEQPTLLLVTPGLAAAQVAHWLQARGASGATGPWPASPVEVGQLRLIGLPALPQTEFDHLLWSCDLNLVRGEDSFVRAQWAGRPFIWQIYPQHDGAHVAKLDAFLELHLADPDGDAAQVSAHKETPGRPKFPCPPRGAGWAQPGPGGAHKETPGRPKFPWPPRGAGRAQPGPGGTHKRWWQQWNGLAPAQGPAPSASPTWAAQARGWRDKLAAQTDLTTRLIDFVQLQTLKAR